MRSSPFPLALGATLLLAACAIFTTSATATAAAEPVSVPVLQRTVDLRVGENASVLLSDGTTAQVRLLAMNETHDDVNGAVRRAEVQVEVNGQAAGVVSGNYQLPVTVGGVQIDCPVTKGYLEKSGGQNPWGLLKDARLVLPELAENGPPHAFWVCRAQRRD